MYGIVLMAALAASSEAPQWHNCGVTGFGGYGWPTTYFPYNDWHPPGYSGSGPFIPFSPYNQVAGPLPMAAPGAWGIAPGTPVLIGNPPEKVPAPKVLDKEPTKEKDKPAPEPTKSKD